MADAQKDEQILRHTQIAVRCLMYSVGAKHCTAATNAFAPVMTNAYFTVAAPVRNSLMAGTVQMKVHKMQ